jgi:hypothetical protein
MSQSLRELGKGLTPQHANGNTIDGDLIDISMEDLVMSINNVPARWLKSRFMQTQFVQRLMPVPYSAPVLEQDPTPFMLIRNVDSQIHGAAPSSSLQNEWRLKGTDNPDISASSMDTQVKGQYAWTSSLYFEKPTILTGLSLKFWQPSDYDWPNTWVWGTEPPEGKIAGQSVDDMFIEVSVDNPFNMENRRLNDIEVHKLRFPVNSQMMATSLPVPAASLSNAPNLTANALQLWVNLDNLCIPLHRDTRVRISLVIPQYGGGDDINGWEGGGIWKPWQSTSFDITTTVLEPLGSL